MELCLEFLNCFTAQRIKFYMTIFNYKFWELLYCYKIDKDFVVSRKGIKFELWCPLQWLYEIVGCFSRFPLVLPLRISSSVSVTEKTWEGAGIDIHNKEVAYATWQKAGTGTLREYM